MKKAKTRIILGVIVVVIAACLFARMFRKEAPVVPTPDPVVNVQSPVMGDIELTTDLVGTIEPADIVYIYPKAGGDVTAVNVKAGDTVAAGQVLVEIDTKQVAGAKIAMDSAKVAWDDAVSTLNRMAPLHDSGFVSDKEFEGYQNAAEAKRLQYESAKIGYNTQMDFSHVASPIIGRVEQLNVQVHDTVSSSLQMFVIAGDGGNDVTFYVTEKVKGNLSQGTPVTVTKEGTRYQGSVVEVNQMADPSVGLFKVKASVEGSEAMSPGTSVEIKVPSAIAKDSMLIPANCVYYKAGDPYVYTYDRQQGTINEVPVTVGIFDSKQIVVASGLSLDDLVITTWTSELKDGVKVTLAPGASGEEHPSDEAGSPAADTSAAQ